MSGCDLVLVLRYRKAVTSGFHALLGALEEHVTRTAYEVRFATTPEATAQEIRSALGRARLVLVLWSFYSPDADALAAELADIRRAADAPSVLHVAGGVHATAEPVRTRPDRGNLDQHPYDTGWTEQGQGGKHAQRNPRCTFHVRVEPIHRRCGDDQSGSHREDGRRFISNTECRHHEDKGGRQQQQVARARRCDLQIGHINLKCAGQVTARTGRQHALRHRGRIVDRDLVGSNPVAQPSHDVLFVPLGDQLLGDSGGGTGVLDHDGRARGWIEIGNPPAVDENQVISPQRRLSRDRTRGPETRPCQCRQ